LSLQLIDGRNHRKAKRRGVLFEWLMYNKLLNLYSITFCDKHLKSQP